MNRALPQRRLGAALDELTHLAGLAATGMALALRPSFWRPPVRAALAQQVHDIGVRAMGFMACIAALVGIGVVLQIGLWLRQFGQAAMVGEVLVVVVVRELAPLLVSLLVIVRSGGAIATELATMVQRGEVEALEAQGIDPLHYLVVPRVVGLMVAVPCMTVFFAVIAFATAYVASLGLEVDPVLPLEYAHQVLEPLRGADVVSLLLKSLIQPMLIGVLCCHAGLPAVRGPSVVPAAASRALLRSVLGVFIFAVLIDAVSYP